MKPALLFDMDGTLIILEEKPLYNGTATSHLPYLSIKDQMKRAAIQSGVPAELVNGLTRMAHIWNATRRHADEHMTPEDTEALMRRINEPFMVEERSEHDVSVLLPDTVPVLRQLKDEGYTMGLVTTASRWSYERLSRSDMFGNFGCFFRESITRDDCSYIKPEPEPIERMMRLLGREDAVYVGDSDHDAQAADAAGCRFVLINTRGYDEETVDSLGVDAVIMRLTELPSLLAGLT